MRYMWGFTVLALCTSLFAERSLVRLDVRGPEALRLARELGLDVASRNATEHLDVIVDGDQEEILRARGVGFVRLQRERDAPRIDTIWHDYEETNAFLIELADSHPDLVSLDTLGFSQEWGLPILGVKISDHPGDDEDEAAILYDGVHHAREPLGNEICLEIATVLTENYGSDSAVTEWVDTVETWIVPLLNAEGFKYMVDSSLGNPWWRKNLRDNDLNGQLDPGYDGVDLNRNYDFNWSSGGSSNPSSWVYRGPSPFSESETRIIRDLCLRERFLLSVCYHSYGEIVYYPWNWGGQPTPDHATYSAVAESVASRIARISGIGHYDAGTLDGNSGMSSNWIYGATGCIGLLIETGTSFIPLNSYIEPIVQENLEGALYLYERARGPGLTGHVTDADSGDPVRAFVEVLDLNEWGIDPRTCDSTFGRYWRPLEEGPYDVAFTHPDYHGCTVAVYVEPDTFTVCDVELEPVSVQEDIAHGRPRELDLRVQAGTGGIDVRFDLPRRGPAILDIYDVTGRTVHREGPLDLPAGPHHFVCGAKLPTGIYVARLTACGSVGIVKFPLLR
jgi:hypothetical protein